MTSPSHRSPSSVTKSWKTGNHPRLLPCFRLRKKFNEVANLIHEKLNIPVYRSQWIGQTRGIKPRSAYKTRRGYKRALRYWRGWDRIMGRTQEKVAYLFMERMEDQMKTIMGIPPSVFEWHKPSSSTEARLRQEQSANDLRDQIDNTIRNRTTPNSLRQS